jgi:hypothetical protein
MTRGARITTGWRVLLMLVLNGPVLAEGALCPGATLQPQYPALGAPPIVDATRRAPSGAECFGKPDSAAMWVTVAAVFRTTDNPTVLMEKFGAISQLLGVQYWSTTEQKWRPLVLSAYATSAVNSDAKPRSDYSVAELSAGSDRYYRIADSRSGHDIVYRLKLRSSRPGSLVVETANLEPIKQWGLTFYAAGGLQTLYFLNERAPGVWAYYSITRVLPNSFLAGGHEKSYINRAVALYRHYASIPTNAEPPAVR